MKIPLKLSCAALYAGLAFACAAPALAGPLALAKTYEGNINFVGTQASIQSKNGGAKACDLLDSVTASLTMPSGSSVVSATLYWAGTGQVDTEVLFDNKAVSAPAERRHSTSIDGLTYFTAAADVTPLVKNQSATYRFGGLQVSKADIYCAKQQKENAMVAGFALVVVYAREGEPYRTLNLYEGMQALKDSSVTVRMGDYVPPAGNAGTARIGYIVWEGDKTGQQKGDSVTFAGQYLHNPPYVQQGDAFNSKSSANGDTTSNGIDFDIVDVRPPASSADASAVFTTGSDRVLLGTAIAALPSKPADLSISKTAAGEFKTGDEITYLLSVSNEGPRADSMVEVKDTLPDALAYVSAAGADWTCSVTGQAVTCKYGKPLAPGASAAIQLKAKITGSGEIRNTAVVSGTGDGVPGNNRSTAVVNAGSQGMGAGPFVFTTAACVKDKQIGTADSGCELFKGPVVAGSTASVYITHAQNGIARPLSTTGASSLNVRYSLECNNPRETAGATASYADKALGACITQGSFAGDTSGQAATLEFAANDVSKLAKFIYPDVGRVTLRMRDPAGNIASASFVSVPKTLKAMYRRVDGGVLNPGSTTLAEPGFAEAGEPFQVIVTAFGEDGSTPLKNFGAETGDNAVNKTLELIAAGAQEALQAQDEWTGKTAVAKTYVWNEVGTIGLQASLGAYLGAGGPWETRSEPVGRFYPQYFETRTLGGFDCLKRMSCPGDAPHRISRAVFSRQEFGAQVLAHGRGGPVQAYADQPHLIPQIALLAVSVPGKNGVELAALTNGAGAAKLTRDVYFQLEVGYDAAKATRGWTAPTAVHVRATASELRKTAEGAVPVTISSLREDGLVSAEGGIMVVNGRLMVNNVIGTPLARTPVPLQAQFWNGAAWEHHTGLEQTAAVQGKVDFTACRRSLRTSTGVCHPSIRVFGTERAADPVTLPLLKDGKASLVLAPLGADMSGTVDLFIDAGASMSYLPSTLGRISFGQFKSPVIYVREMY